MTFNMRISIARAAHVQPTELVSIIANHRREHSCHRWIRCAEEDALIEILADAARASEATPNRYGEPPWNHGLPREDAPIFPGLSTLGDQEASDARHHRAAVNMDLVRHCAGALYYHEKGDRADPWSLALYDERETFINRAKTVLGAEDHWKRGRRS